MSLLNTSLQTLVVRLRDMSGNISQSKLHNRVFDAYEAKALVFEALTPAQQVVMKQFNGIIPPQHPAGQPLVIENWTELIQIHREDILYQLLPRRAKNNAGYSVMQAICHSAGSPFTMEHRVDPNDLKMVFRDKDIEYRNQFNAKSADKITTHIWFDGLLTNATDSGLIMCYGSITAAHINNMAGTLQFLREWINEPSEGDRHRQTRDGYKKMLEGRPHLFLGTLGTPGRELLTYAKSKGVYIYSKRGSQYVFNP